MQAPGKLVLSTTALVVFVLAAAVAISLFQQRVRERNIERQLAALEELGVPVNREPQTGRLEERKFYADFESLVRRIKEVHPDPIGSDDPFPDGEVGAQLLPILAELEALSRDPRVPGILQEPFEAHANDDALPWVMALRMQVLMTETELQDKGAQAALPHLCAGLDLAACVRRPSFVWFVSSEVSMGVAIRILPELFQADVLDFAELRAELEPRLRRAADPSAFDRAMGAEAAWLRKMWSEWDGFELDMEHDGSDVIEEMVRQVKINQSTCPADERGKRVADVYYGDRLNHTHQGRRRLNIARVALALRVHHEAHGDWPVSLDALAPLFAGVVPADPCTGIPFDYALDAAHVRLAAPGPADGSHVESNPGEPGLSWAWPR